MTHIYDYHTKKIKNSIKIKYLVQKFQIFKIFKISDLKNYF